MALFNRNKSQSISDLENYYANRNNSTGRAWVMALLSLIVTILIIAALFFGVRWIYRSLSNDETTVVTTTQTNPESEPNVSIVEPEQSTATNSNSNPTSPTTPPTSEPNGVVSDRAASTTTPNASGTATRGASTTSQAGNTLPNTGTDLQTLVTTLIVVTFTGYFFARNRFAKH